MAHDLTPATAWHDDANSEKHERDRKSKSIMVKKHWEATPSTEFVAGAHVVDKGVFQSPIKGFSVRLIGGTAVRQADSAQYTRDVIKMSNSRRKYKRVRMRPDKHGVIKSVTDSHTFAYGAFSLITTLPPWAVGTIARMRPVELEDLLLRLTEVQAQCIKEISGIDQWGAGIHLDTPAIGPHWHNHLPKSDSAGIACPVSDRRTAGPWMTYTSRIDRKFPGLLDPNKRARMQEHFARKDDAAGKSVAYLDVEICKRMDRELDRWIASQSILVRQAYEADCLAYSKRKTRLQKEEAWKKTMQSSLSHFSRTRVWNLAYRAMTLTAWRMIPPELRLAVRMSIKATQITDAALSMILRECNADYKLSRITPRMLRTVLKLMDPPMERVKERKGPRAALG